MKKIMKGKRFEFHLFEEASSDFLKEMLNDSHIKIRGFVKDLDSEIASSDIFLVSNNLGNLKLVIRDFFMHGHFHLV